MKKKKKKKEIPGDIIILHMCAINENHMMYGSWDMHSVWGRNKYMWGSSHMLCCGCMGSCAIHVSFALHGGDIICACCANKAECQWTRALSSLIT